MTVAQGNEPSSHRAAAPPPDRPAHDDATVAVELQVAQLLRRAERTSASGARGAQGRDGSLDRSGYLLLHALSTDGALHVNALAARLGLDASTVTRQVVALERAGHVRRARDRRDGRAVVVEPTDGGLEQLERHRATRAALYSDVLRGWSPSERSLLAGLLMRLNADLDDYRRRRTPS
jgi:DNA-binding MarR family transcriptional regulator